MKAALIAAVVAAIVSATAATAASTGLITGVQIKNGSVGLIDLSASAKRALKGQRGPAGPAGAQGVQGVPGGFDPAKLSYAQSPTVSIAPDTGTTQRTYCPSGSRAISGGWVVITGGIGEVYANRSDDNGASWTISVWNNAQYTNADITPFAVCAAR